jgi:hypothetical protein
LGWAFEGLAARVGVVVVGQGGGVVTAGGPLPVGSLTGTE